MEQEQGNIEIQNNPIAALPGGGSAEFRQKMEALQQAKKASTEGTSVETKVETPVEQKVETSTETPVESKVETPTEPKIEAKEKVKTPDLFSSEAGGTISFDKPEDLVNYMNEQLGTESKTPDAFIKDYKSILTQNDELSIDADKGKKYEEFLVGLPEDLKSVVLAYDKQQDYRAQMKSLVSQTFDFSVPFSNQNQFDILNHFYKTKFGSMEAFNEMRQDERKYNIAKDKFDKQRTTAINTVVKANEENIEKYKKSLSDSISYFNNQFPNFTEVQKRGINKILEGGEAGILSMFYTKGGLLKKEAAELVALMKFGKEEISRKNKREINKAVSKANEDIITRGKDNPDGGKPKSEANINVNKEKIENYIKTVLPGARKSSPWV